MRGDQKHKNRKNKCKNFPQKLILPNKIPESHKDMPKIVKNQWMNSCK